MWLNTLKIYLDNLYKNNSNLNDFKKLNSDYNRVCYCINKLNQPTESDIEKLCKYYKINNEKCKKNANLSDNYRNIGNKYYKNKQFKQAFNNYLLALQYAPSKSDQLLYAYSNRSALFYELKLYNCCLADLNRIKEIYKIDLEKKLLYREANCYLHLKQRLNLKQVLQLIESKNLADAKEDTDGLIGKYKQFISSNEDGIVETPENEIEKDKLLHKSHSKYTSMSDLLDVKYSSTEGRYCVIDNVKFKNKQKIDIGEVLFHEKPYCSILLPEYQHNYCDYCYKELVLTQNDYKYLNIETCDECVNVFYCSIKCKFNAFNYHMYECSILNLLFDMGIAHLAYRILTTTNLNVLLEYKNRAKQLNDSNSLAELERYFNTPNENTYNSLNYESVFQLVTNSAQTHVDDLYQYTLTSILLSKFYLKLNGNQNNNDRELLIHFSTLLVRHIQQTICNAHAITKLENTSDEVKANTYDIEQLRYATAIYPTVSLMNHSCDPNVICSFKMNTNEIIIKLTKTIEMKNLSDNQEIHIWNCYGPHYLKMTNSNERKQILKEQYHFDCKCQYCCFKDNDDGNFEINENNFSYFGFKCMNCSEPLLEKKCQTCNYSLDINDYICMVKKIRLLFNKSDLNELKNCFELYEKLFMKVDAYLKSEIYVKNFVYLINYTKLLDKIARLLCEKFLYKEAASYLDRSIKLLKFIYSSGVNSQGKNIEIAFELFKMSEVLCNANEFKIALKNVDEAIEICNRLTVKKDNQLLKQLNELKENILLCLKQS